jgi:signal transduction histidine kinase
VQVQRFTFGFQWIEREHMDKSVVLCVDDESNVLKALLRELKDICDDIVLAESAMDALEILAHKQVDVVVSDMRMPCMNGAEFLGKVRDVWPNTFRILLTGYSDYETVVSAVNQGEIHRFLTKPWQATELFLAVKSGIERSRLLQQNKRLLVQLEKKNTLLEQAKTEMSVCLEDQKNQLEKAYLDLVRSEKLTAVGRLAAGVVHEVLNPLTVAIGRLDMVLLDSDLSDHSCGNVEIAIEQVRRGAHILDNLRDFSKQKVTQQEKLDVHEVLLHTIDLLLYEFRKKNIQVHKCLGSLALCMGDADQLGQVFLNILGNAIDALSDYGDLWIYTKQVEFSGDFLIEIEFRDSGCGISDEDILHVFDPFYTTKDQGTGLGLAISQSIIENHRGWMNVRSQFGKGTSFFIYLPISP